MGKPRRLLGVILSDSALFHPLVKRCRGGFPNSMDESTRRTLIERHRLNLASFGYSPLSLHWATRREQLLRFRVLGEIGVAAGDSLLDVGCAFADLERWLAAQGKAVAYTGIDLSPELLEQARNLNPGLTLLVGELFDFDWPERSFDWVLLSGTLNWQLHDGGDYARRVVARMFHLCRRGVAFNLLDAGYYRTRAIDDLVAFDARQMLDFCCTLTPSPRLRSDYLPGDFTLYLHR